MSSKNRTYLLLFCIIFFNVGIMFCMNDILFPILKEYFKLSFLETTLIQVSFYAVYVIWPLPIAKSVEKYGYKKNIFAFLIFCLTGCLLFIPAFYLKSYPLVLLSIFTLSTGITIANVVANPYVTLLGDPAKSHMRLNLVQAMSRVGYAITPIFASSIIYLTSATEPSFHFPYLVLSVMLLVTIGVLFAGNIPDIKTTQSSKITLITIVREAKFHRRLLFGVVTLFFYMGVESCTAGFYISYFLEKSYSQAQAATGLTLYYVLAASFALLGAYLLTRFSAGKILTFFGIGMAICLVLTMLSLPHVSVVALTLAGGFLSVMFPTIFSLSIEGVGSFTEKGSVLLNFAIVGGAIFPPLQGLIADSFGISVSYVVPLTCSMVVIAFGYLTYMKK
ncbi:MAG: MFS transporter [Ginsengibacter sp.]